MKNFIKGLTLATAVICSLFIISCNDDEGKGDSNDNTAPSIANQTFTIDEGAIDGTEIGTVAATDLEKSDLSFSIISGNEVGAFAIEASSGVITIADENQIDFETTESYTLNVEVSDGELTNAADMTINVNDLDESEPSEDGSVNINGKIYTFIDGSIEDYGNSNLVDGENHYNMDFLTSDGELFWDDANETYLSNDWSFGIFSELYSSGTSFEDGIYYYVDEDAADSEMSGKNVFSWAVIGIDGNDNRTLFETDEDEAEDKVYQVVGGTIEVTTNGDEYTLVYDLTIAEAEFDSEEVFGTEFQVQFNYTGEYKYVDWNRPEGRKLSKKSPLKR